jgi:thiol-disulfide isomerase/thioredoxin
MKLALLGFVFLVQVFLCTFPNRSEAFGAPSTGSIPGPISGLEHLDGTPINLQKYPGSVLIMYFGADWCPPCVAEGRPAVLEALKNYKDQGVKVLYMNLDDNSMRAKKAEEAKQLGVDIAMSSLDLCPPGKCKSGVKTTTGVLGEFGKIYWYPSALVFDKAGVLRAKIEKSGPIRSSLNREVESALKR